MSTTLYAHPDGHEITMGDGLLVATKADGTSVSLPIGSAGLEALAAALLAVAAQHDDAAERAGASLAHDLLSALLALRGRPQADAYRAVCDKLQSLCELGDGAAGGFATGITFVLVTGIANLPKLEG